MKKITFFAPPLDDEAAIPSYNINLLATIATSVSGCSVSVFDSVLYYNKKYRPYSEYAADNPDLFLNEIIQRVEAQNPEILFMTAILPSLPFVSEFSALYKKRNPETVLVLGGIAATVIPEEIAEKIPSIDYVAAGEGEHLILELIKKLNMDDPGLKEKIIKNNKEIILDELPNVNYDHLKQKLPRLYMEGGRGCTYSCLFCGANAVFKKYKKKAPARVIDEMEFYRNRYGTDNFSFIDNNFTADENWLLDFCDCLNKRNLKTSWDCATRIDVLSKEALLLMKQSGCAAVFIGLESKFAENLRVAGKIIRDGDISLIKYCVEIGITPTVSVINGFPEETAQQINDTFDFIDHLSVMGIKASLTALMLLAGSPMYEEYKKGLVEVFPRANNAHKNEAINLFSERYIQHSNFTPRQWLVKNKNLPREYLEKLVNGQLRVFVH